MKISASYRKIKKHGKTRHRCVVSIGGKESVKLTANTRDEAWTEVIRQRELIKTGFYDAKPYTFGEAAQHWLEYQDHLKPITVQIYDRLIRIALASYLDMPLQKVAFKRKEIQTLILGHSSGRHIRTIVTGTCDTAMAEGDLPNGHRLGVLQKPFRPRMDREIIPCSPQQLNTILENMPDNLRLLVLLGRGCGLRIGEALSLETNAIGDGWISVSRGTNGGFDGTPKHRRDGDRARKVPIPYWLEPEINEHVERYAKNGVLFPAHTARAKSRYLTSKTIYYHLPDAARNAGLPADFPKKEWAKNFTFHQFRKNYAEQWRSEHVSLGLAWIDIKQFLGHRDLSADVYSGQPMEPIIKGRGLSDPRIAK